MNKNINLNLYKIFYEVAKYNSISAASKNMYLSQPAISKAIKNLENELDVILFYRTLNGIILTEKGKELFLIVEQGLNSFRLAEKKMEENINLQKGSLSIGIRSHIASFYLIDKIAEFHKKYNKIDITIISRPSAELLKLMSNNEIDFVIDSVSEKDELDGFSLEDLETLSHCFIALPDLVNKNVQALKDLEEMPLILPVAHSSHRQYLNALLLKENIIFKNTISIETSELILDMVKKGLGIGYILRDMVKNDLDNENLVEIKIKEELPKIFLKLIYKEKNLAEASRKFIEDYLKK